VEIGAFWWNLCLAQWNQMHNLFMANVALTFGIFKGKIPKWTGEYLARLALAWVWLC
jgi:hypothetical protein